MTHDEIIKLIKQGEGIRIEFKSAENSIPDSLYETVVSFSNTDGGTILIGVADAGKVEGIREVLITKFQKNIVTALNSRDCINPPLYIQPGIIKLKEGSVIVIQIQSGSQVHDHAGRIYYREFESDIDITDNQNKVSELYLKKRNFFSEGIIYPHLSMTDFDNKLFEKARTLIRNFRSDHPWLLSDNEQMLRESVLWKKDFFTGQEGFTLAAALIFGKDQTIQNILTAYKVEAMLRIMNKDRWDDRITLRTNLIDTYLELKQFINKHLPEKFYMEGDQRIDLRDKIFREVIGNVIVHREYTSALSTDMIITDTEVTITNPNKPLFHGPIDPTSFNPFPKNPNIRKFFTAFGWTDEIGSGIRNTFKYLPHYIPGAKPVFIENDTFKSEIPLILVTLADFAKQLLEWLDLPETTLSHLHSGLANISLPSNLSYQDWEEVLLYLVPSWHRNSTQHPQLKWSDKQFFTKELRNLVPSLTEKVPSRNKKGTKLLPEMGIEYQDIIKNEIKKVPSWSEKGAKLLSRRSVYLLSLLYMASEPIKREEMMEFLDYENRKTFNDLYLKPLLQSQLVRRTNEERPRASNQQYMLTEAGKAFLGGILR